MTVAFRSRTHRAVAVLAAVTCLTLTGCAASTSSETGNDVQQGTGSVTTVDPGAVVGSEPMPAPVGEMPVAGNAIAVDSSGMTMESKGAPSVSGVVTSDRSVIKSASTVIGVDDMNASRASVLSIVASAGGTVTNEFAYKGGPEPQPQPMYSDQMTGMPYPYPYYGASEYVDVTFTVPSAQYEPTVEKLRGLGEVISLQQSKNDVTAVVVDLDARIEAAQASVDRIEALMTQAATLDETLRLEQELTMRQGNLESLQAQQASMTAQVAESTITVRLIPNSLLEQVTPAVPEEPTFWDDVKTAFTNAWSGFALAVVITSPLWILALTATVAVLKVRRNRREKATPATNHEYKLLTEL